jgi:hypothetical protein|tara:strand:- start:1431 stop:1694 length:264 start_codon:yes stop_codon:yes gene_type:complete
MTDFSGYSYQAFSDQGEYQRPARTIHELPSPELRMLAVKRASEILGITIHFGQVIGVSNRMTRSEISRDETGLLALKGCDLPLSILA